MYGLSKIHKQYVPFRPIVSSINTYNYKLASFLVNVLKPISSNSHTVQSSFSFSNWIQANQNYNAVMCSYDVTSLFTNVPLDETINISLNKLYNMPSPPSIPRTDLKKLLLFATKESHFIFNGCFYDQIDGVGMGSPLGPVLANIFMVDFEEKWITNNINTFSPICWKRYVDDTFTLFNNTNDANLFLNYLNNRHPNIKFTSDMEETNKLPFLDILIIKENNQFQTTVFHKKTFTGLYTKWDSFIPRKYKVNLINTLLDRFWKICSNDNLFNQEVTNLKQLLIRNGYPNGIINYNIKNFIKRKNTTNSTTVEGPEKLTISLILPYVGYQSDVLKKKLCSFLSKFYGGVKVNVIFRNRFNLATNFKFKDRINPANKSCLVYQYLCSDCNEKYIGKTVRCLRERKKEHFNALTKSYVKSSIANHIHMTNHSTSFDNNFKIIDYANNNFELTIKEAFNILENNPKINENNDFQLSLY